MKGLKYPTKYPERVYWYVDGFGGEARVRLGGWKGKTKNGKVGKGAMSLVLTPSWWTEEMVEGNRVDLTQSQVVCGDCPLRKNRVCYVTAGATTTLGLVASTKTLNGLVIDPNDPDDLEWLVYMLKKRGRFLRLGEFGEPVLLGEKVLGAICDAVSPFGWTGYTHQWRREEYQWSKEYLCASVHTVEDALQAKDMGWRRYRATPGDVELLDDEVMCPHVNNSQVKCKQCKLCSGNRVGAKSIFNPLEGVK